MILPAYEVDRAPVAYEVRQERTEAASAQRPRGLSLVLGDVSQRGILVADPRGGLAARADADGAPSEARQPPVRGASDIAPTNIVDRAQLARVAFAGGWIFLVIALFCLAQSFSVIAPQRTRRWRAVRAHS